MSATHQLLTLLPLSIFMNLREDDSLCPNDLRSTICNKLKELGRKPGSTQQQQESVTTLGQLLNLSPPTLLRALDPLLTHNECKEFVHRVCLSCSAASCTALDLLNRIRMR